MSPPINRCKLECPRGIALQAATWQETAGYSPSRMFLAGLRLGILSLTQTTRANFVCPSRNNITGWLASDFCRQSTVHILTTGRISPDYLTDHELAVLQPYIQDLGGLGRPTVE